MCVRVRTRVEPRCVSSVWSVVSVKIADRVQSCSLVVGVMEFKDFLWVRFSGKEGTLIHNTNLNSICCDRLTPPLVNWLLFKNYLEKVHKYSLVFVAKPNAV